MSTSTGVMCVSVTGATLLLASLASNWGTTVSNGNTVSHYIYVYKMLPIASWASIGTARLYGPYHKFSCAGNETRLRDCRSELYVDSCEFDIEEYGNSAGVACTNFHDFATCSDNDIRLVDGTAPNNGRVEVCFDRTWGSVCDNSWGTKDARVVCRQLGYHDGCEFVTLVALR